MKVFVTGASGATGQCLVVELLNRGQEVRTIVRSPEKLPEPMRNHRHLSIIQGSILELSDAEIARHVSGCGAVASCLGHNISLKGVFGHPRRLVTEATRRICVAISASEPESPVRYVLMNTAGNINRDLPEQVSFWQRCAVGVIRLLVPPQPDNEQAADYLRISIGRNDNTIEWSVVRPDSLVNKDLVSEYEVYPSPIRSALFNPGHTSRINVAHFMAGLITDDDLWNRWKGQMPVIYNKASPAEWRRKRR